MNVLIPMAGAGSRFANAGYTFPKPLIDVRNKPMIQVVVENLGLPDATHIFICQKDHYEKYALKYLLQLISPGCRIILTDGITQGAACTTLLAEELIDNDKPLIIANSDQYICGDWQGHVRTRQNDGNLLTFKATHPKWSFVRLDSDGNVAEVAEKRPISDIATCGIYSWARGKDYVRYAKQMIEKNVRVNGEFYVAPVYNEAIGDGMKFGIVEVNEMHGLGTPEDLNAWLRHMES